MYFLWALRKQVTNRAHPIQILTVADLLDSERPDMPTSLLPYFRRNVYLMRPDSIAWI